MRQAPETPSTEALLQENHLVERTHENIALQRERISRHLRGYGFVAILGGCSVVEQDENALLVEGSDLYMMQEINNSLAVAQRHCVWKPRTNPNDWHGEETGNPLGAHSLVTRQANRYGQVAMEVAFPYHMERYGDRLSFAWSGARNIDDPDLILHMALQHPTLPFGVKNGLDGDIEPALAIAKRINEARSILHETPAPAVVIWRGGTEMLTPQSWEAQRQRLYEASEGRFIDDTAHGSAMAHDPDTQKGDFGQNGAIEHLLELRARGYGSRGVLIEASDVKSLTDPNLPFSVGRAAIEKLLNIG